jgi:argininosuccinate synthase
MPKKEKIVLAFSGGLDTSVILKWLQNTKNLEVVTFTADIGQGSEIKEAEKKARSLGVKEIFIENLTNEFVKDYVFPMFRANTLYEGHYLLGTSIARPLIAKKQIQIANEVGASYVSHGATGKGNDQIRFELAYYAENPKIKVIAPWREWNLKSRNDLIEYANNNNISFSKEKKNEPPYSMDANILHTSYEGKILEDPWLPPEERMFTRTVSPEDAPNISTEIEIEFLNGDPVKINHEKKSPEKLLSQLNEIGGKNGVGRLDLVENRFVGMKSRGIYETPGGTILFHMRKAIESITIDKGAAHLKEELMPKYAELIYNGFWFAPERKMLQKAIDLSQKNVNGTVRAKLYKGNVIITGRKSQNSLYDKDLVTFEEGSIDYNHHDAEGFIKLNALRLMMNKLKQS